VHMIGLTVRVVLFVALAGALGLASSELVQGSGPLHFSWNGWIVETELWFAVLATLTLCFAAAWVWRMLWLFLEIPRGLSRRASQRCQERGFRALSQAMVALHEGRSSVAVAQSRKAARWMDDHTLPSLVAAQSLALENRTDKARDMYQNLLERPETATAGALGLLDLARTTDDTASALAACGEAVRHSPRDSRAWQALLSTHARTQDWNGASRALRRLARLKVVSRKEAERLEAVLFLKLAEEDLQAEKTEAAIHLAVRASKLDQGLAPAAILSARLLAESGKRREAEALILEAWKHQPMPDLAVAWMALPERREEGHLMRHLNRLVDAGHDDAESCLLLAGQALKEKDWSKARTALEPVMEASPSVRACAIMATIEIGENGDRAAAGAWLSEALRHPNENGWCCKACESAVEEWDAACPHCGAFASLAFRSLPRQKLPTALQMERLAPLLVGVEDQEALDDPGNPLVTDDREPENGSGNHGSSARPPGGGANTSPGLTLAALAVQHKPQTKAQNDTRDLAHAGIVRPDA